MNTNLISFHDPHVTRRRGNDQRRLLVERRYWGRFDQVKDWDEDLMVCSEERSNGDGE